MANYTKTNKGMRYGRRKKQLKKAAKYGANVPVLTESYGLLLLQETARLIEEQPAKGLISIRKLKADFAKHLVRQKSIEGQILVGCLESMSIFLEAFAIRLLGDAKRAIKVFDSNIPECDKCAAEYHRFMAAFQKDIGQLEVAEDELCRSLAIYKNIQGNGHNLSENGTGSCLVLMAHIKHSSGDNDTAIDLAMGAYEKIDPHLEASSSLYFSASGNLAIYLFFANRIKEAEPYLTAAESHWNSTTKITVPRMLCLWLRGLIFARRGHEGTAKRYLEDAVKCAKNLGFHRETTMITSDYLALLALSGGSFWLLSNILSDLVPPESAVREVEDLRKAIGREDMQATWLAIRSLRHYSASNALVVPYVLPEMKVL